MRTQGTAPLRWRLSDTTRPSFKTSCRRRTLAAQQATTCSTRAPAWLDGMARSAGEEGLNHQVVSFKSPADTPKCPECCGNHGFCAAVPVVRIHLPPAESQQRWLIVSSAIAQESSTAIAIRSRSADRGGRVAPPAADPSQATGRVKRRDNQLHRARVLEVRIQSPPAESPRTIGSCRTSFRLGSGSLAPPQSLNTAPALTARTGFQPFSATRHRQR